MTCITVRNIVYCKNFSPHHHDDTIACHEENIYAHGLIFSITLLIRDIYFTKGWHTSNLFEDKGFDKLIDQIGLMRC